MYLVNSKTYHVNVLLERTYLNGNTIGFHTDSKVRTTLQDFIRPVAIISEFTQRMKFSVIKVFSNKIAVTLVTQSLPSSFLSRPVS